MHNNSVSYLAFLELTGEEPAALHLFLSVLTLLTRCCDILREDAEKD